MSSNFFTLLDPLHTYSLLVMRTSLPGNHRIIHFLSHHNHKKEENWHFCADGNATFMLACLFLQETINGNKTCF